MKPSGRPRLDPFQSFGLVVTLFVTALPVLFYAHDRIEGTITTPEDWFIVQGHDHGPWREGGNGLIIYMPFLLLIPITALAGVVQAVQQKRRSLKPGTVVILVLQVAGLLLNLKYLFWLAD